MHDAHTSKNVTMNTAPNPDREALVQIGETVRAKLDADPAIQRAPTDKAEVYAVPGFLAPDECAHLMALIDNVARPSTLYDDGFVENYRTSWSGNIDKMDSLVQAIERRFADVTGIELAWSEAMQGQRYHEGEEYREHCDWFDTNAPHWPQEQKRGGQRSWTAMTYLNAVEAGGQTDFLDLHMKIVPQPGLLLLWNNVTPDGTPNRHTIHYARKVERGVKYVITKWFRTRPWS